MKFVQLMPQTEHCAACSFNKGEFGIAGADYQSPQTPLVVSIHFIACHKVNFMKVIFQANSHRLTSLKASFHGTIICTSY